MSFGMDEMLRSVLAPWTPRRIRDEYLDYSQHAYYAAEILAEPRHGNSWNDTDTNDIGRVLQDWCHQPVLAFSLLKSFLWLKLPLDFLKRIDPENLRGDAQQQWQQICNRLRRLGVVRLWPNLPLFPQAAPSSSIGRSDFENQRSLVGAAGQATDGQNVTWAIIDTEVFHDHEVLHGTSLDRYEIDQAVAPGQVATVKSAGSTYQESSSHGTHVAGIIRMLAPATRLLTIALPAMTTTINGQQYTAFKDTAHLTIALEWLLDEHQKGTFHLDGVNLSLGQRPEHQDRLVGLGPGCPAVTELWEQANGMVVIAAGNYGDDNQAFQPLSITDPANAYEAIVVGACDKDNPQRYGLCTFSSRGPTADGRNKPDFIAPGLEIISCGTLTRDEYFVESGTSQAAPFLSGVLAILRGAVQASVSNNELLQLLKATGDRLGREEAWVGGGLVNVKKALDEAKQRGWLKP